MSCVLAGELTNTSNSQKTECVFFYDMKKREEREKMVGDGTESVCVCGRGV